MPLGASLIITRSARRFEYSMSSSKSVEFLLLLSQFFANIGYCFCWSSVWSFSVACDNSGWWNARECFVAVWRRLLRCRAIPAYDIHDVGAFADVMYNAINRILLCCCCCVVLLYFEWLSLIVSVKTSVTQRISLHSDVIHYVLSLCAFFGFAYCPSACIGAACCTVRCCPIACCRVVFFHAVADVRSLTFGLSRTVVYYVQLGLGFLMYVLLPRVSQ